MKGTPGLVEIMPIPPLEHRPVDRRNFLRATTAAAASPLTLSAASYARVSGSNQRINLGFIGCGGRAQAHINLIVKMALENRGVTPMAVCDVWDGVDEEYEHTFGGTTTRRKYTQGLYPSAKKCGLDPADRKRVVKDYRRLLDLKDIDAVCIATPDHWHARQTLDAFAAGKDVYVEKPMTRTVAEALAVQDAARKAHRVLTVGVQALADPIWLKVRDLIKQGRIGPVSQCQTGAFRNDIRGQWRFYRVLPSMTPKSLDWDLFVGHRFEVAGVPLADHRPNFDPALFAQWRCYRPFSRGPLTDLLAPPLTRMLAALEPRVPQNVVAFGSTVVEQDGRTVPDVASVLVQFEGGMHLTYTSSTGSAYPVEEVIRGRLGTIKFVKGGAQIIADDPRGGASLPTRLESSIAPQEFLHSDTPRNETEALWDNFLACVRDRNPETLCGPELGGAAAIIQALAVRSFDEGQVVSYPS
jgi:predicted dehydrogenase